MKLVRYSPRIKSSVRRGDRRNQLIALRDGFPWLMPVIVMITRVRYRSDTIVLCHRHRATTELVLQRPLPHMMPRARVYLLR